MQSTQWTTQEKRTLCAICTLADKMKDCKACAFYMPQDKPQQERPKIRLNYSHEIGSVISGAK